MVHFQNVSKIYDNKIAAVNDVTFKIEEGEFVFLIGPSGSGKTTVIKMLIRDEVPSNGSIYFNDKDITRINRSRVYQLRREVGVIFQDFKLVQDKTAYENVAFAMEAAGKKDKDIKETVPYVLDIVGLSNRMNAFPRQLSGGEQQRVAIARAIANNPKILIADEPTGNLDPASAWDIVQILSKINNWGTTIIMSTHGTDIVNSLNKRVIQMEGGKVMRDDNKGQYEMTASFEDSTVDALEDEKKEEVKEEPKAKKSTFQFHIPKQEEAEEESQDEAKQKGFSLFGLFKRGREGSEESRESIDEVEQANDDVQTDEPVSNEQEEVQAVTSEVKEDQTEAEVGKGSEETKVKKNKKSKNDSLKKTSILNTDLNTGLAEDRSQKKKKKSKKSKEDKNLEKFMNSDEKTLVDELNLPKQVRKDLKSAGFKYVEDILNVGPEGLSESLVIDPEEVVLIAKEIKKFVEKSNS